MGLRHSGMARRHYHLLSHLCDGDNRLQERARSPVVESVFSSYVGIFLRGLRPKQLRELRMELHSCFGGFDAVMFCACHSCGISNGFLSNEKNPVDIGMDAIDQDDACGRGFDSPLYPLPGLRAAG